MKSPSESNTQPDVQAAFEPDSLSHSKSNARLSQDFPTVYPSLNIAGQFRSLPEDFIVHENLGFSPAGDGEHCLIHIEKIGQNTHWVAEQLAILLNVDKKAIGYCGRKDRHAVTRQWLSIYDPHRKVDFASDINQPIDIEGVRLLESTRHSHKLRPGDHQSNHFCIRLRNVKQHSASNIDCANDNAGKSAEASEQLLDESQKLQIISAIKQRFSLGLPNYFGSQRFGRDGNNIVVAANWFENKQLPPRKQKSIIMSAARSYLFNKVLALRVEQQCWASAIDGDVLINDCPTAPLWGRGRLASQAQALDLETLALEGLNAWCHGLEHCGLKQERRATVLHPTNFDVNFENDDLVVVFDLISGAFATSILAEICSLQTSNGATLDNSIKNT